ncbi:MAG: ABC transporter substrate-binding protein [Acidimicrobiales bacterium]
MSAPPRNGPRRRSVAAVAAVALVLAALAGCSSGSSSTGLVDGAGTDTATEGGATGGGSAAGTLTVGLDSDPPGLDPAGNFLAISAFSIGNALYDTLMAAPFDGPPQPRLAESLTESADRLSWTLVVRDGVTFHDGTALDAAAVKLNLDRQRASQLNGPSLSSITDVTVLDERTVRIALSAPWTALPAVLAGTQGMVLSPTAIAAAGQDLARAPVGAGTGPYRFVAWVPDDHLTVARNDAYWDGEPGFEEIVFRFLPDENARLAAYQAGDVQLFTAALGETVDKAREADGGSGERVQVVEPPVAGQTVLYLNTVKAPFDDVRVRRAMLLALDLDALAEAIGGSGYADYSWSVLPKDSPWYAPPTEPLRHDPDQARRLIADYEADTGRQVTFTYKALSTSQTFADAGRAYAAAWNDVGMDVDVENVADLTTLVLSMILRQYDVAGLVAGYYPDPDTVLFDLYHSGRTFNLSGFSDPRMDALLEQARASADPAERKGLYAEVQQLAREQLPLLNGNFGTVYLVGDADLTGVEPTGYFPARTIAR